MVCGECSPGLSIVNVRSEFEVTGRISTRGFLVTGLVIAVLSVAGCGSATGPTCSDKYGRGSNQPDILKISCSPLGSDIQCRADATNVGDLYVYCPVTISVTDQTSWESSNPAIATFVASPAGLLEVHAAGRVEISGSWGYLRDNSGPFPFAVAPGVAPEGLIKVSVLAEDSRTSARLQDAFIEIAPERGETQTCITGNQGGCLPYPQVLPGTTRVRATKAGYQPAEALLAPPTGGSFQSIILKLVSVP